MRKWLIALGLIAALSLAAGGYFAYILFGPACGNEKAVTVRIRSGWTMDKLAMVLSEKAELSNNERFVLWVQRLGYQKVRPCTIEIPAKASIYEIAGILKKNRYQTVNITILGSMNLEKLANVLASKLEIDADSFVNRIESGGEIGNSGFNETTWPALFLPNTYNFTVATGIDGFIRRMEKEYDRFWNAERMKKADKQGFTPLQISVIASIVTKESNKTDEYVNIAGVYINRLRRDMLLQADPTVAFARGSEGRILLSDLSIESPYNTYLHKGLPPGPICIPNLSSIEAVLNYSGHSYLYFVADPKLNGYHHFSTSLAEHLVWAAKYHAAERELRRRQNSGN